MWLTSVRDMQLRRRRFVVGAVATAIVFGITLTMQGLSTSLTAEADETLTDIGADLWVVSDSVTGPFTGVSVVTEGQARAVEELDDVDVAAPVVVVREAIRTPDVHDVVVVGHRRGGPGTPTVTDGTSSTRRFDAVVDAGLPLDVGDRFRLGSHDFSVVGTTSGRSLTGGIPLVYVDLDDAQDAVLQGLDVAVAVVVRGQPASLPPGLQALSTEEVRQDLLRPIGRTIASINLIKLLLWVAAAGIVSSVVYLTTLERIRDFALFKSVGASARTLFGGIVLQSTVFTLASAAVGAVGARLLVPLFPLPLLVPWSAVGILALTAVMIGVAAGTMALRHATAVDPALAFGGG